MDQFAEAQLKAIISIIDGFMNGDLHKRIEGTSHEPTIEDLRVKINSLLQQVQTTQERNHKIQTVMADALSDWYNAFKNARKGDLEVSVEVSYGDDFLDKLSIEIQQAILAVQEVAEQKGHDDD